METVIDSLNGSFVQTLAAFGLVVLISLAFVGVLGALVRAVVRAWRKK